MVLLLDCWGKDTFACRVPPHTASINSRGGDFAGMYNRVTETVIRHVPLGELHEVFVIHCTMCLLFAYNPPIDVAAIQG